MSLFNDYVLLREEQKSAPSIRLVADQIFVILARVYALQKAYSDYSKKITPTIAYSFPDIKTTVDLIDAAIQAANEDMNIDFNVVVDLRAVQRDLRKLNVIEPLFNQNHAGADSASIFVAAHRSLQTYQIVQGDSLRGIAQRFLGDQTRWQEILALNNLDYPYIIDSRAEIPSGKNVKAPGDILSLPIEMTSRGNAVLRPNVPTDYEKILGTDIELRDDGFMSFDDGGDFKTTSGVSNLTQALRHRLMTDKGELPLHPTDYGSNLKSYLGRENVLFIMRMAGLEATRDVSRDPRLTKVDRISVLAEGTVLQINFDAYVINSESPSPMNLIVART